VGFFHRASQIAEQEVALGQADAVQGVAAAGLGAVDEQAGAPGE
jgi:hypothetical protein